MSRKLNIPTFSGVCLLLLAAVWLHAITFPASFPPPPPPPPTDGLCTEPGNSVESLVEDVFVGGFCENISNIQPIGNVDGISFFRAPNALMGIDSGVMISTGLPVLGHGPNTASNTTGILTNETGDQDLSVLATGEIMDATGIEFDFVPLDSFVTFRYVFASEEYCEYVGSQYNDVFGFFISGPGINGPYANQAINVALIPGTDAPVAINSVNHDSNSNYYQANHRDGDAQDCGLAFESNENLNRIEYDGFTVRLTATAKLWPCQTYHIRLVVGDVADQQYDSAVFLEAQSFSSTGLVTMNSRGVDEEAEAEIAYEGCTDAFFLFERSDTSQTHYPITINYTISPSSTATLGQDFAPFPMSSTIPIGENSVILPIEVLNDNLNEGTETLVLELDIPCGCFTDTASLIIIDPPVITIDLPAIQICEANNGSWLVPTYEGGVPPYELLWSDNSSEDSLFIEAGAVGTYSLSLTDACGNLAVQSTQISLREPPQGVLTFSEQDICQGENAMLDIALLGDAPFSVQLRRDGENLPVVSGINNDTFSYPAAVAGTYELIYVEDQACPGNVSGSAEVRVWEVSSNAQVSPVACFGTPTGSIAITPSGGIPPYEVSWTDGQAAGPIRENLLAGSYSILITDSLGCRAFRTLEVPQPSAIEPIRYNCDTTANLNQLLKATGGTPPYLYYIDGFPIQDEAIFGQLAPGENYDITIEDANGCLLDQSFIMPASYDSLFALPRGITGRMQTTITLKPTLLVPESSIASIAWHPDSLVSCADCLETDYFITSPRTLELEITDIYGCSERRAIRILGTPELGIYIPTVFSPNGDGNNDRFTLFSHPERVTLIQELLIFDRWGELVFQRKDFPPGDPSLGWDGQLDGQAAMQGAYIYIFKVLLNDGNEAIEQGSVVLIR